ncbi:MAG: Uma2 family endonuclease [Xenococcaceae cyanobacterium MO_167.B27]|nr:Uma2 family endonuclease [Xenococcaceae cyanobacterium MO_167.B27]
MMLFNTKLPINSDRLSQQDHTLSLAGMTWEDFEKFNSEEYPGYRVSYFNGVITLVSPSKNHERIAQVINYLVVAYCKKINLPYYPMGSTTLKNPPLAGKEPDVSFAFNTDKDIPDLAIEVVYSSAGVGDLEKYQALGVKEVWFWQNNQIRFYRLFDSNYMEVTSSECLPQLTSDFLINFVNRGFDESPLTIEADFIASISDK